MCNKVGTTVDDAMIRINIELIPLGEEGSFDTIVKRWNGCNIILAVVWSLNKKRYIIVKEKQI